MTTMSSPLRYTLVADGTSDRALLPILRWLILRTGTALTLQEQWADPSLLCVQGRGLESRLSRALELYPCDLLFVHRDAEAQPALLRHEEILAAVDRLFEPPQYVCVVPLHMTEAWLLSDEPAIRTPAGKPRGKVSITLPRAKMVENIPDPKQLLNGHLREASETSGRRLAEFRQNESGRRLRVAELTRDFAALLDIPAFRQLDQNVMSVVNDLTDRWKTRP